MTMSMFHLSPSRVNFRGVDVSSSLARRVRTDGGLTDLGIAFIGKGYGSFFDADTPAKPLFSHVSLNSIGRSSNGTAVTFAYGSYALNYGYCCGADTARLPNGTGYTLTVGVPDAST